MTRWLPVLLVLLAGCAVPERQSALDPAGTQAGHIHGTWDLYLWVCAAVYVLVMAFLVFAIARRNRAGTDAPVTQPPVNRELRMGVVVSGCVAVTTLILFVFLIADFVTGRRINALIDPAAQTVTITGHQWWWEVQYQDATPSNIVTTANEIHVPVGRTIHFELKAADVIHSFWIPNLHGKTDLIPPHTTHTFIRADRPGEYWGQCAEFCGFQHANMRFVVVAEPEEDFQRWLTAGRQPAREPTTESQKKGLQVFLTRSCVLCHTITGTSAASRVGPDLTRVGSRPRIGAGTLPNTRGNLAGWVSDPHGVKPGVRMPPNPLPPDELQAILDYLESLK